MTDLAWPAAFVLATALLCLSALHAWRGWLDFKRLEIAGRPQEAAPEPSTVARIEIADLRERLRKLEAIATGVDP